MAQTTAELIAILGQMTDAQEAAINNTYPTGGLPLGTFLRALGTLNIEVIKQLEDEHEVT